MTIVAIADADPDPTTQIAWPSARNKARSQQDEAQESTESVEGPLSASDATNNATGKRRLSTWNLITLSVSMAGAQIAWTVELGYGTPFLLKLGLSEQLTSLVWLAGPLSGLIMQPLIGAISDSSTSKYRRRYWIGLSTLFLMVATITLAYCEALAAFSVDLLSWDPKRDEKVKHVAIGLAVASFYVLDFALNALQASLRNLLLDITPPDQLSSGNAWHGRMTHAGNIIGFGFGFLPLSKDYSAQFRNFCLICITILTVTVVITCFCHEEEERRAYKKKGTLSEVFENIRDAITQLPRPIRRVCLVQLFAFMGWFPFLFYSTTYIGQVMAYELDREPDPTLATRTGALALLIYSVVGVIAGTVLPHLAARDRRLLKHKGDVDDDAELSRLRSTVRRWKLEAARKGRPLRLPMMPFLLRNIWTGALLLFSVLTFLTFFVTTVVQATIIVGLVGISWAVAVWVPFAIIMELLKETKKPYNVDRIPTESARRPQTHIRAFSQPSTPRRGGSDEHQPLLRRRSFDEYEAGNEESPEKKPVAGGTILGVHNLAIVAPQLIVSVVASLIFNYVDSSVGDPKSENTYYGKTGVGWVLRFGGLCTLIGAMLARKVPPTATEKEMRRRLGEMKELHAEAGTA